MTNRYLEKIAARVRSRESTTSKVFGFGGDINTIRNSLSKKNKKSSEKPSGRKWSRASSKGSK